MRLRQFKAIVVISLVTVGAVAAKSRQRPQRFIDCHVRFTNTGDPAKQATIELRRRGSRKILKIARTDLTGHYRIEDISPGFIDYDCDTNLESVPKHSMLTSGYNPNPKATS